MIYSVTVKPHSKKGPLVVTNSGTELTVYLREKPVAGAANQALVQVLAQHFNIPKTQIKFKSGLHGRRKIIEIP